MDNQNYGIKKFVINTLTKQLGESPINNDMLEKKNKLRVVFLVVMLISLIGFTIPFIKYIMGMLDGNSNVLLLIPVAIAAIIYGVAETFYKELKKFVVKEDETNIEKDVTVNEEV